MARDWLLPGLDDGRSQLSNLCASGNYLSPLHRGIRVVGFKCRPDLVIRSRHVTLHVRTLRFGRSTETETGPKRYLFSNIDYEERITFVDEMANLREAGPGQQMMPGALPEDFVEPFSTIASGMRISLRATVLGNGRKELDGISWESSEHLFLSWAAGHLQNWRFVCVRDAFFVV
ncbi:hypothetical protein E4U40_003043 [Claviceps sp. LM458 group G5]|nr:hypothetical protein E4U40_003043 [Claviceps sp. LM458 group G5]